MFKIGMCSVTFRNLTVNEIIDVAKKASISGIEWGSDVHVPPVPERAKEVARLTERAGLEVTSYGSYYRLGQEGNHDFEVILQTAIQLKASGIRVWAGSIGSDKADEVYRKRVAKDAQRIADLAKQQNILIHLEYHRKTLTDTAESTVNLLTRIDRENVFSYWQPAINLPVETRLINIKKIHSWLSHVHVFHWFDTEKLPLLNGLEEWKQYLQQIGSYSEDNRYLMLEFVKNDDINQFFEDVKALKSVIKHVE